MSIDRDLSLLHDHTLADTAEATTAKEATIPATIATIRRIRRLIAADNEPNVIDGYPTKTPGASPPGPAPLRLDDDGNVTAPDPDDVDTDPTSRPTERAALALAEHGAARDPIHQLRLRVERNLHDAVRNLTAIGADLARFDNLQSTATDTEWCWVARVILKVPHDEAWNLRDPSTGRFTGKRTRFDGILNPPFREQRAVCRWVYDFARKWRRLPTADEALEYARTGYVLVRTDRRGHEVRT